MISIVSPKTSYHNICDQTSVCNQLQLKKPEVEYITKYPQIMTMHRPSLLGFKQLEHIENGHFFVGESVYPSV